MKKSFYSISNRTVLIVLLFPHFVLYHPSHKLSAGLFLRTINSLDTRKDKGN